MATIDESVVVCATNLNKAFIKKSSRELRKVTGFCVTSLAVEEKPIFFTMALLSYVLSKMIQKPRYKSDRFFNTVGSQIGKAYEFAKRGNLPETKREFNNVLRGIASLEKKEQRYVRNIIEKGRTKIAGILYAEGLSLGTAVSMTGARKNEVLNYSGKTVMSDRFGKTMDVMMRLAHARSLLK